jgi:ABC-type Na+ transport system ATPase subunit NatA
MERAWLRAAKLLPMALLRMREACFDAGAVRAGPVSLQLQAGERRALALPDAREATIVARMAAGLVKATRGCVLLEEYDPRVQPVHCKRIAAFVPHDPLTLSAREFERYIVYRAALWKIDPAEAIAHARLLLGLMAEMHEAFAYPLASALVTHPRLVVLDRPQAAYARTILAAVGSRALLSTHAGASDAAAFARAGEAGVHA